MSYNSLYGPEHPLDALLPLPSFRPKPSLWQKVRRGFSSARQQRTLRDLNSHILRDIGQTPSQTPIQADPMGWDVPPFWRR